MPKVEFKKTALPTNEKELQEYIEDTRKAVIAGGEATDEALKKVEADLKVGFEAKTAAERAEKRVTELEESLKALHEQGRIGSDDQIEKGLRSLPTVHKVERDEDYKGRISGALFNVLALSRKELRLYLDDPTFNWAMRFRRLNNMVMSMDSIMRITTADSPQRAEEYRRKGGFRGLPVWKAFEECLKQGARAIDVATAGGVLEWVPTLFSADKFDDVRDQLQISGQLRIVPMPQSPWKVPGLTAFMTAYVIPEAQADAVGSNTQLVASDPTSANVQLDAKKIATLSWFSREVEQDSIVAILPMYDEEMTYAQAYGIENGVLNGQSTATIDTGSDPATTDVRDNFDGLRRGASLIGSTVDLSAGLTAEKLAAMIQALGKYANPNDCVFGTGYAGLAKALILKDGNGNLVYLTRERAGDAATLFTGTVGILMGYPLAVSGAYPQNMNNAGVIDGITTTKTGFLLLNKRMWLGGSRQGVEVDVDRSERFSYDQIGVRSIQRFAFKALITPSASKPHIVAGVGL